jgi:uridine kinase
MKGDVIVVEEHHRETAKKIVPVILSKINEKNERYIITVAGESGSGKSETGKAVADELEQHGIKTSLIGQDDYFTLAPQQNDEKRREDPEWLGPHVEVKLDMMQENINDALAGKDSFEKPLIDYNKTEIQTETINLTGVKVLIAEGTYTSLLRKVDTRIFIAKNRLDTLEHRRKRNRGGEVDDPFVEHILKIEHKIIAGHKYLADFIITKDADVIEAL